MKKKLFIILALCSVLLSPAQEIATDSLAIDTMSIDTVNVDTMSVESLELLPLETDSLDAFASDNGSIMDVYWTDTASLTDIEWRTLEWCLSWIDTTECVAVHDTTTLPDSVYKARLQALPCVIELPYNERVRAFILRYVKRNPKQVARLMRMGEYYFPIFEEALGRYNLPYELKYLPVIESALNPMARSHVGAAGLWQFMPGTGKLFGLEINSLVDERMDPIKSTEAACRFLNSMFAIYNDWNLVIAAYNCGSGNVNKAIRRAGGKHDFWSIYPYLPRETRNYVPIFIAANYAMNYGEEHGICKAPIENTMITDTIRTTERMHLQQVSENLRIDMNELRRLNPQYSRDILPGGSAYTLCLPAEKTGLFIDIQDSILTYKADSLIHNRRAEIDLAKVTSITGAYRVNGVTYYTIKNGDSLSSIAKKFHCSVNQLKKWNNLSSDMIRAGKKLKICK
ncbi:MAG: transglycosylase SLT domain-containing protein [Paludibacteraceae bacterium]|nr:transglycosylase SLT domain-containing protein [Paludibacteraceae bacterium]